MTTVGEKTEGGGGLPILENRDSISSLWRVCKAWISIMCLGKNTNNIVEVVDVYSRDHQHQVLANPPRTPVVKNPLCDDTSLTFL